MGSLFYSNDINISDILSQIDKGNVQLPDFQRGWVWDDYRIRSLIASISNSYPVGAVMFLEYGGDSVRFKHRLFTGAKRDQKPDKLVLDGQQRLTSIYCSLYSKNVVETVTEKKAPIKRFYYLDIDKCLDENFDRVDAILSIPEDKMIKTNFNREIKLDISTREKEFENLIFPLNIVYDDVERQKWLFECINYNMQKGIQVFEKVNRFSAEVLTFIQTYKVPVITLGKETPKEAVCQVFENVNTGGVSLTVFELVTAAFAADDFELRKDWEGRYKQFTKHDVITEVSATDFLTALSLLVGYRRFKNGGAAVSCKKKDVLNLTLDEYKTNANDLTSAFIECSKFLKEQRIFTQRNLPYSTQLIPMAALFTLLGNKVKESNVKNKIARWYWCGVLGEMYGGANETRYATDVTGLMSWILENGQEPDTISRAYFNPSRLLSLQTRLSAAYKGIMALLLKAGCKDFISGSDMDFTTFLDENTDVHHIFPRAYCEVKGYKREKWNSIVNKTPLFSRTNRILGGTAPSNYLRKIENSKVSPIDLNKNIESHLVNSTYLRNDNFDEFFAERAKLLLDLISNSMGKAVVNRDSDETIELFGKAL